LSIETLPLTALGAAAAAVVEKAKPKIIRHPDGVYFGLSEEAYFADDALGSTDLKRLLLSGAEYWFYSLHNPHRPEDDETRARRNGHAVHTCILFGREAFDEQYVCELLKEDYPDALVTADDIKRELRKIGGAVSGAKADLIARLKGMSSKFVIWDDLIAEQAASGRKVLKYDDYWRIVTASDNIRATPVLEQCFENGVPEVSVFWTSDGVRFRARFDYLRLFSVIDLKSFTNITRKPPEQAVVSAIYNNGYDIQSAHYLNGRHQMRRLIRDGKVFGDCDREWLARLAEVDNYVFTFVFHSLNGAPISEPVTVVPGSIPDGAAAADIGRAVHRFKQYRDKFGEGQWFHLARMRTLTDDMIPAWHRTAPID
jgi:PDDEXK-like domain of unknown function (DUF3799)